MFSNRKPAAKRRRHQISDEKLQGVSVIPKTATSTSRKKPLRTRVSPIDKSHKNYLSYDALNSTNDMNSTSLSDLPINLSDSNAPKSANQTINSEENINLSRSSAKRDKSVNITRVSNNEKPTETGNTAIKLPNHKEDNKTTERHSAVTVQRVIKSDEPDDKPQTDDQEKSRISPTLPSKTGGVKVIKIPRKKSAIIQRKRSASIPSVSVIHLDKPSVALKP